jgi:hypothetical protein
MSTRAMWRPFSWVVVAIRPSREVGARRAVAAEVQRAQLLADRADQVAFMGLFP